MLHSIIRDSNRVWQAMYYDELIDKSEYQISYLEKADRPYFNCAQVLQNKSYLDEIEDYFLTKKLPPAIYIDPEGPKDLEPFLRERGYQEVQEEQENWYSLDCGQINFHALRQEIQNYHASSPDIECVPFLPLTSSSLLDQFIKLNGWVNKISPQSLNKLKQNLLHPKDSHIQFICFLVCKEGQAISCGLVSCFQNKAFLSEGATHPKHQNKGIYSWHRKMAILLALQHKFSHLYVNCDRGAYSNHTYKRLGFQEICKRQFFIKI